MIDDKGSWCILYMNGFVGWAHFWLWLERGWNGLMYLYEWRSVYFLDYMLWRL